MEYFEVEDLSVGGGRSLRLLGAKSSLDFTLWPVLIQRRLINTEFIRTGCGHQLALKPL